LKLSSDLYGAFDRAPRLKLAGALAVFRSIYILAGVDDALNDPGTLPIVTGNTPVPDVFREVHYGRDYFLGASLQFSDADFSTLAVLRRAARATCWRAEQPPTSR
jgi:hypothetical protein